MTEQPNEYYSLPVLRTLPLSLSQLQSEVVALSSSNDDYQPFLHEDSAGLLTLLLGLKPEQTLTPQIILAQSEQYSQKCDADGWQTLTYFLPAAPNLVIESTFHNNSLAFTMFAYLSETTFSQITSSALPLSVQQFFNTQVST